MSSSLQYIEHCRDISSFLHFRCRKRGDVFIVLVSIIVRPGKHHCHQQCDLSAILHDVAGRLLLLTKDEAAGGKGFITHGRWDALLNVILSAIIVHRNFVNLHYCLPFRRRYQWPISWTVTSHLSDLGQWHVSVILYRPKSCLSRGRQ